MKRVYVLPLSSVLPLDVWRASEATLAEGGGVAFARRGGPVGAVTHAVFTGLRDGSPAWLLCAGLPGAICVPQKDGTCEWSWVAEPLGDVVAPSQPYSGEIALRPTQRPGSN